MKIWKILRIVLVLIIIAAGVGYYLYNKPVADTGDLDAAYSVNADSLFQAFESDELVANKKYLGKIIQVNGKVRELSIGDSGELNMVLSSPSDMFGINCGLMKNQSGDYKNFKVGDSVVIKGECAGISMDVVLTRCVIVK